MSENIKNIKYAFLILISIALGSFVTVHAMAEEKLPLEHGTKVKTASPVRKNHTLRGAESRNAVKLSHQTIKKTSDDKYEYLDFEYMMRLSIDMWLIDRYQSCWKYTGKFVPQNYIPRIRVQLAPDGTLMGVPSLINPPSDPNLRPLADSAVRAVNRCNPLNIPKWFKPNYNDWRDRIVRFDPRKMS